MIPVTSVLQRVRWLRVREAGLMVGFICVGALFTPTRLTVDVALRGALFVAASLTLVLSIYGFNSYAGFQADIHNQRLTPWRPAGRGGMTGTVAGLVAAFLLLFALVDPALAGMACGSFLLWASYSAPQVGLKHVPVAGTCVHFVAEVLHFHMGYLLLAPADRTSLLVSGYFALLFAGGHAHHEVIDHDADRLAGSRTAAVVFGQRVALGFSSVLFAGSGVHLACLWMLEVVSTVEAAPFLVAYALHMAALTALWSAPGGPMGHVLRYRSAYRFLYLSAGAVLGLQWLWLSMSAAAVGPVHLQERRASNSRSSNSANAAASSLCLSGFTLERS